MFSKSPSSFPERATDPGFCPFPRLKYHGPGVRYGPAFFYPSATVDCVAGDCRGINGRYTSRQWLPVIGAYKSNPSTESVLRSASNPTPSKLISPSSSASYNVSPGQRGALLGLIFKFWPTKYPKSINPVYNLCSIMLWCINRSLWPSGLKRTPQAWSISYPTRQI